MARPSASSTRSEAQARRDRVRIRNRVISILGLLAIIIVLFAFLVNYSGFNDWKRIDTNLTIFVAVNVNIVLLTTVFYLLLRNLFKLIYERKQPFAGVRLKTKLIIAFVALSLPSTAFHLMASGFMAFLFENWSQGEFSRVLANAKVVTQELSSRDEAAMRQRADEVAAYLPHKRDAYLRPEWLGGYRPRFEGGVFVYDQNDQLIAQWVSGDAAAAAWQYPPPQDFQAKDAIVWSDQRGERAVRHVLRGVPDSPFKVEVLALTSPELTTALTILQGRFEHGRYVSRDLAALVLTFLIVMTLLIIFAATWIAFYLARGFVAPIERLDDATHRVSEGELGYQVDHSSLGPLEADFAGLVTSFNTMSRQLKEQNLKLLQTTEDLRASHHQIGERNRLVELLLENIDAGIISLNPQGDVTALNRTARRLVQLRQDPWQDRHYRVVLQREVVDLLDDMLEQMRTESKRQLTRNLNLAANRKSAIIEVNLLALENQDGRSEGTVALLKDVSALQRSQRALAWREVARRIAHEIKNPLTPIQLSAQRIRRRYLEQLDGEGDVLDQCTATIINEVASLKKMVNEFSLFAKLPESRPVPGDLNSVIQELSDFYENGLPEHVRLDLELDGSVPPFPLDKEQMKRAFTNLIDNAVAALNGGGTITIRTAYDSQAQAVNVEVMDDGAGVPDHIRARMFEPYTSTKEGGTGLGLTIVNQIVSDHNGYIRYSDRKPRGTVFSMEFRLR
jgi:two-component system, NtrC family, nitrogen regulation sensor histidine kinase NtrY